MRVLVTGLPHSGRRHFIAVLLLSLDRRIHRRLGGPDRAELYNYRQRLLDLGRCLPRSTPFVPFRLPARLVGREVEIGGGGRDLLAGAGETPPGALVPALQGVDGVIHLVDASPLGQGLHRAARALRCSPPADPEVAAALRRGDRDALARARQLRAHRLAPRPAEGALLQLAWALRVLEGRLMGRHLRTPLALVFTKTDLLDGGDPGPAGRRLRAMLPAYFETARAFGCSALRRAPRAGVCGDLALPNEEVLAPLRWIMEAAP